MMLRKPKSGRSSWLILFGACSLWFAIAAPSSAKEVTQEFKGVTLNASLEVPDGGTLEPAAVVITHGIMTHNRMEIITRLQELLKENEWPSLALNLSLSVDNRHGFYDCAAPHHHLFSDGPHEIHAWVDWLKTRNVRRVYLLGHSTGANQTLGAAVQQEDPAVAGIILLGPSVQDHRTRVTAYEVRYKRKLAPLLSKANALVTQGQGGEMMEETDFIFCPKTTVSAASFADFYEDGPLFDVPSMLKRIGVPTLVIGGSLDERQPDIAERVTPYADGERVRLVMIDTAGHFFRDLNADDAADAVVDFLEELERDAP